MKRFGGTIEVRLDAVSQASSLLETVKSLLHEAGVSNERLLSLVRLTAHEARKHERELLDVQNRRSHIESKRDRKVEREFKYADR
jgi:hypothetical protein